MALSPKHDMGDLQTGRKEPFQQHPKHEHNRLKRIHFLRQLGRDNVNCRCDSLFLQGAMRHRTVAFIQVLLNLLIFLPKP